MRCERLRIRRRGPQPYGATLSLSTSPLAPLRARNTRTREGPRTLEKMSPFLRRDAGEIAMKRLLLVSLAFLVACNGMGSGGGLTPFSHSLLPAHRHKHAKAALRVTIPRRRHHHGLQHNTISPNTKSFTVSVNGATPVAFDTTLSSPDCQSTTNGLVCTYTIAVPIGSDTFVVKTWSQTGGAGVVLDQATAVIPIVANETNSIAITL